MCLLSNPIGNGFDKRIGVIKKITALFKNKNGVRSDRVEGQNRTARVFSHSAKLAKTECGSVSAVRGLKLTLVVRV
jgi:hypothetical protein